jgi:hypothetical protein
VYNSVTGETSVGPSGYTLVHRNIIESHGTPWNPMERLSDLGPKLTCIGAKLAETWRHANILFRQDGYQGVAICLSTNL